MQSGSRILTAWFSGSVLDVKNVNLKAIICAMQSRKKLPMQFMRETHREKQMNEESYQIIDMRKDMSIKYYSCNCIYNLFFFF